MTSKNITGSEYQQWLEELKTTIRNSQLKTALKINAELLSLYWELGEAITKKQAQAEWGDKIISQLSRDLTAEFKIQGFSVTNLKYIRRWYQFYAQKGQHAVDQLLKSNPSLISEIGQQRVDQMPEKVPQVLLGTILGLIPWGHHIQIFTKCQSIEEALFYVLQTVAHNWKRSVLIHWIDNGMFHRKGKSLNNFPLTLPQPQSELANELIKNPLYLEFLNLNEEATERDLENAILANIKKFLLELGAGFAFCGQQYHMQVGENDYYIDLLFYHTRLHCYFVVELKVVEFEPEQAGKLEFYITAIDEQLKQAGDNPTIGLLLCKFADKVIVEYSLKTKGKPIGVTEYKHAIPKEWENKLPDVEALKNELEKEIIIPPKPVDEKLGRLKEIVARINVAPADVQKNREITMQIYTNIVQPLIKLIDEKLSPIKLLFNNFRFSLMFNQKLGFESTSDFESFFDKEKDIWVIGIDYTLEGFKSAGTKVFDLWKRLFFNLSKFKYGIGPEQGSNWEEWVYRKLLNADEMETISDRFIEIILDEITYKAEMLLDESAK
jgi:predicted nuclease of restriction endonuclease-like (RecB) superfamily